MKEQLFGKTDTALQALTAAAGLPAYRGRQLAEWLYRKHAVDVDAMSSLPGAWRKELARHYTVGRHAPRDVAVSRDGTRKYLFATAEGQYVESALIPDGDRRTLCLSTQAGCRCGCRFCMTGRQGFQGNLGTGDILNQYASCPERDRITNIVYMGMGEPLDNPEAVFESLRIFTAGYGYAMSPSRLTVSTIGLLPALQAFLDQFRAHLAVSLHTPDSRQRAEWMPLERRYPIRKVIERLRRHDWSGQRRLTFEYALFKDLNDSPRHARETVRLLNGLRCRVNLIPFNPAPELPFIPSPRDTVEQFQDILKARGITATIRKSKGQDIAAACGLLSTQGRSRPATEPGPNRRHRTPHINERLQ